MLIWGIWYSCWGGRLRRVLLIVRDSEFIEKFFFLVNYGEYRYLCFYKMLRESDRWMLSYKYNICVIYF